MAAIKLEKVEKWFGDVKVIPGLDLEIAAGDFLVLVGPSGCGKTTTMRMIAGLEDVSSGRIMIEGQDVTGLAPSERGLSMVFQSYALYPHMTVAENMGFGLKNLGAPAETIKAKVAEAATILRLDQLLARRPKELSGGQRQRVAIGRAIVREPKAFLFDEPLSNLDAALRVEMRFEIGRLHRQLGKTMIYVTHDQVEAMTLADKIVLMDKGEIVQAGSPRDLYERPANLFAARFIGSPRMNILPCELQGGRYVYKDALTGEHDLPEGSEAAWLGIRPEHIEIAAATDSAASCRGKIELVEYLGAETYVYVGCPGLGRVTVRTDGYSEGAEDLGLRFDPRRTHFFGKNERTITGLAKKPAKVGKKTFSGFMNDFESWRQEYSDKDYLYRGQNRDYRKASSNAGNRVTSSLYRMLPQEGGIPVEHLEETIIAQARQAIYKEQSSNLEILTDIQHYRGKTNCIDFTHDPFVALFFACYGDNYGEDGELIFLDAGKLTKIKAVDYPRSSRQMERVSSDANIATVVEPASTDASRNRIESQHSVFVRSRTGYVSEALYAIKRVPAYLKKEILECLANSDENMISINTMFNDLPGFVANKENFKTSALAYAESYARFKKSGKFTLFLKDLDIILSNDSGYAPAYFERGLLYQYHGYFDEAIANFTESFERKYAMEDCLRWRAAAYAEKGDFEQALDNINEVSSDNKTDLDYYQSADINHELGRFQTAKRDIEEAILRNRHPEYLKLRSRIESKINES